MASFTASGAVTVTDDRVSVFDRVGVFSLMDRKANSITIPIELAREASKAYHTTIVGYFLGSRVPFPIVQRYLRSAWGKYGFNDVMMNNNGFFFIKFNDEGRSTSAMEEGMIMIRNVPMFVGPWDPSKGLSRPSHDSCPLWVKFHNIPLVLFNQEGISRIASALGVPKRMDACTSSVTRSGCSVCCVFGHKQFACAKAVQMSVAEQKKPLMDEDGFVRVERKQWRRKVSVDIGTPQANKEASSSGTKEDGVSAPVDAPQVVEPAQVKPSVDERIDIDADDTGVVHPTEVVNESMDDTSVRDLEKAKERKRLGLEFEMPVP
ncbi:hypothetical protein OSB04_011170 [Centaurea solstitialis]|uniref:DUF4283 domain-containing protein n=1 Tax=Centaurea solstitialis TaxID=347529 RepID=A0AA38TJN7_9ASTR|nr:hypothetical protein OSB04_011170 [Centaurea solstitialis]